MNLYFVTYGNGSDQANNFSVVEAEDYREALDQIAEVCGNAFAFCYTEQEFDGQAERYGLTRIPLQKQTRGGDAWTHYSMRGSNV